MRDLKQDSAESIIAHHLKELTTPDNTLLTSEIVSLVKLERTIVRAALGRLRDKGKVKSKDMIVKRQVPGLGMKRIHVCRWWWAA